MNQSLNFFSPMDSIGADRFYDAQGRGVFTGSPTNQFGQPVDLGGGFLDRPYMWVTEDDGVVTYTGTQAVQLMVNKEPFRDGSKPWHVTGSIGGIPIMEVVFETHDQAEAHELARKVVMMDLGSARALLQTPISHRRIALLGPLPGIGGVDDKMAVPITKSIALRLEKNWILALVSALGVVVVWRHMSRKDRA